MLHPRSIGSPQKPIDYFRGRKSPNHFWWETANEDVARMRSARVPTVSDPKDMLSGHLHVVEAQAQHTVYG